MSNPARETRAVVFAVRVLPLHVFDRAVNPDVGEHEVVNRLQNVVLFDAVESAVARPRLAAPARVRNSRRSSGADRVNRPEDITGAPAGTGQRFQKRGHLKPMSRNSSRNAASKVTSKNDHHSGGMN